MSATLILALVILVGSLALGVPIAYSFTLTTLWIVLAGDYQTTFLLPTAYGKITAFTVMAIPLFITAGMLMNRGRLGDALIDFVDVFIGRVKGGLGMVATVSCAVFGAICGSGIATLTAIGSILAPRMTQSGYPKEIVAAIICSSAPLGMLIPPSVLQLLIAWTGSLSVMGCFISTVVPGLLLTFLLCLGNRFLMRRHAPRDAGPRGIAGQWVRRAAPLAGRAVPALLMPFIILGGIYSGIMTATEAAGVTIIYIIPVCMFFYKGFKLRGLKDTLVEAGASVGAIMVMMTCVVFFSRILVNENLPSLIIRAFLSISDDKYMILLMINVFLLIIGMFMDDACGVLLCTPLLMPLINEIGVNPYQFAAILGVNLGFGSITPPAAPFIYVSSQIVGVDPIRMMKPVAFLALIGYLPTIILTTYFPELSLWLPRLMGLI